MVKMTFYIKCDYKVRRGHHHDDGDGTRYSGFDHEEYYDHTFNISDKKMDYPDATFASVDTKSYVVAVIYGDGGTFGRTDGYIQYIGAFSKDKADKIAAQVLKVTNNRYYKYNLEHDKKAADKYDNDLRELKDLISDKNFYAQWLGYFSSFEKLFILCSDGTY